MLGIHSFALLLVALLLQIAHIALIKRATVSYLLTLLFSKQQKCNSLKKTSKLHYCHLCYPVGVTIVKVSKAFKQSATRRCADLINPGTLYL